MTMATAGWSLLHILVAIFVIVLCIILLVLLNRVTQNLVSTSPTFTLWTYNTNIFLMVMVAILLIIAIAMFMWMLYRLYSSYSCMPTLIKSAPAPPMYAPVPSVPSSPAFSPGPATITYSSA